MPPACLGRRSFARTGLEDINWQEGKMNHMETRRLRRQLTSCLIHSALAFALVLAPGSGWAGLAASR
jgi:hypothetical protein